MGLISEIISGVISPVTNLFSSIVNKKEDTKLEMYKVDGKYDVEAMRQDTAVIQARVDLAKAMKDDPTTKMGRRFFVYPVGIWFAGIVYYCVLHPYFPGILPVLALPTNLEYIPYAVIAYLFVSAWKK